LPPNVVLNDITATHSGWKIHLAGGGYSSADRGGGEMSFRLRERRNFAIIGA